MVREYPFFDLNLFKSIKIWLVAQTMFCLSKCSMNTWNECVYSAVVVGEFHEGILAHIDEWFLKWFSISLHIFCLLILLIIRRRVLKFPTTLMNFSISLCCIGFSRKPNLSPHSSKSTGFWVDPPSLQCSLDIQEYK